MGRGSLPGQGCTTLQNVMEKIRPPWSDRMPRSDLPGPTPARPRRHGEQGVLGAMPSSVSMRGAGRGRDHRPAAYRYLRGARARIMPVPLMNVLNGVATRDNNVDCRSS